MLDLHILYSIAHINDADNHHDLELFLSMDAKHMITSPEGWKKSFQGIGQEITKDQLS